MASSSQQAVEISLVLLDGSRIRIPVHSVSIITYKTADTTQQKSGTNSAYSSQDRHGNGLRLPPTQGHYCGDDAFEIVFNRKIIPSQRSFDRRRRPMWRVESPTPSSSNQIVVRDRRTDEWPHRID